MLHVQNLDSKAYGVLFRTKDNTPIPPDEYIVFRVYDKALVSTLSHYLNECRALGADERHLEGVSQLLAKVLGWQNAHPDRMKVPDVESGERMLD
jgi:hypothetical protein